MFSIIFSFLFGTYVYSGEMWWWKRGGNVVVVVGKTLIFSISARTALWIRSRSNSSWRVVRRVSSMGDPISNNNNNNNNDKNNMYIIFFYLQVFFLNIIRISCTKISFAASFFVGRDFFFFLIITRVSLRFYLNAYFILCKTYRIWNLLRARVWETRRKQKRWIKKKNKSRTRIRKIRIKALTVFLLFFFSVKRIILI